MVATSNNTWMLESDVNRLHEVYKSIKFDTSVPEKEQFRFWIGFIKVYAKIEFPDKLELVNIISCLVYPTAEKKCSVLKSEYMKQKNLLLF